VYVNRPLQAHRLAGLLRSVGFNRVAEYTGQTTDAERRRVERLWRDVESDRTDIDLVVATSAFGLGINQVDVRAIIHARVPESLNRLYQEVGRGGRDGLSSLALLLTVPHSDLADAAGIAGRQLLNERLEPRWHTMFDEKVHVEGHESVYWMNVESVPFDARGWRTVANSKDRLWNMNALTLLQRARLIRLHEPLGVEAPDARKWVGVEVLDPRIFTDEWRGEWQRVRDDAAMLREAELTALEEVVYGRRAVEDVLSDALELRLPGGERVRPDCSCGGCPACRTAGYGPRCERPQVALVECEVGEDTLTARLHRRFGSRLILVPHGMDETGDVSRLMRAALAAGARRCALPDRPRGLDFDSRSLGDRIVFAESEIPESPWRAWKGTTEVVLASCPEHLRPWLLSEPSDAVRIVLFPRDAPDPERIDRLLCTMRVTWTLRAVTEALRI